MERRKSDLVCPKPDISPDVLSAFLHDKFKRKGSEFRRRAAACLEVAERMSLEEDRKRMIDMAEHWFQLARRAEAETEEPE